MTSVKHGNTLQKIVTGLFVGIVFLLVVPRVTEAKIIYYGSETETVPLAYGGPTIIRFNQEVKTISQASRFVIKPADEADPNYAVLSVTPRFTKGGSKVTFILADGAVVNTNFLIVTQKLPEKTDSFYDFKPKESLLEDLDSNESTSKVSEVELMKAMIRWDEVVGYQSKPIVREVDTGIENLSAKLVRLYTGPTFNGYVFKIRNNSEIQSYTIDLKNLLLGRPNMAVLSQIDRSILKPTKTRQNVTFLRIVAKSNSIYYNVNLPVAPVSSK